MAENHTFQPYIFRLSPIADAPGNLYQKRPRESRGGYPPMPAHAARIQFPSPMPIRAFAKKGD